MKKTFAFVLAIILLCPAALADAQNQLNTPGTFQAEYSSNSGRTKITVDATVYVPEVMCLNTGEQTQIHACSSIKGETLAIQTSLEKRSRGSSSRLKKPWPWRMTSWLRWHQTMNCGWFLAQRAKKAMPSHIPPWLTASPTPAIIYAYYSHIYTDFEDRAMAPAPGQEYITLGYTRGLDC